MIKCVIVTQGNMRRQTSPRGLLPSDKAGWHSPHDSRWPTPTTQQQMGQTHNISTIEEKTQLWESLTNMCTACILLLIPVYSADRWHSPYIAHSGKENRSPLQTRSVWHQKLKWDHGGQRRVCSSRCDWEVRIVDQEDLCDMMPPCPLQVRPTYHSTPIKTKIIFHIIKTSLIPNNYCKNLQRNRLY